MKWVEQTAPKERLAADAAVMPRNARLAKNALSAAVSLIAKNSYDSDEKERNKKTSLLLFVNVTLFKNSI